MHMYAGEKEAMTYTAPLQCSQYRVMYSNSSVLMNVAFYIMCMQQALPVPATIEGYTQYSGFSGA